MGTSHIFGLVLRYKIGHTSDHSAKFRGDRLTELGDTLAKFLKVKTAENIIFMSAPKTTVSGRTKKKNRL